MKIRISLLSILISLAAIAISTYSMSLLAEANRLNEDTLRINKERLISMDMDRDGIHWSQDLDIDGDGICNDGDHPYPKNTEGLVHSNTDCSGLDLDDDNDGIPDEEDPEPWNPLIPNASVP